MIKFDTSDPGDGADPGRGPDRRIEPPSAIAAWGGPGGDGEGGLV